MVEISSANSAAKLRFSDFDGRYFSVALNSPALNAEVRVYVVPDLGGTDIATLLNLFKIMSENWKGWTSELNWGSLEGEFEIIATSDRLGHANLNLKFFDCAGPAPWSAEMDFALEAMQVEAAHKQLVQFFS